MWIMMAHFSRYANWNLSQVVNLGFFIVFTENAFVHIRSHRFLEVVYDLVVFFVVFSVVKLDNLSLCELLRSLGS